MADDKAPITGYFKDSAFRAEAKKGRDFRDAPAKKFLPPLMGSPGFRERVMSAAASLNAGLNAASPYAQRGNIAGAAIAGLTAPFGAPSPQDYATQQAQSQSAGMMAALDQLPVEQVSPALVEAHPELEGLPLGLINKITPILDRQAKLEQFWEQFQAAEAGRNARANEVADLRRDIADSNRTQKQELADAKAAEKQAKADAETTKKQSGLDSTMALYETARDGLINSLDSTATGPVAGRLPALTSEQQTAEGAVAAMAPVLKQLFRVAGEGVFTDRDQELLLKMIPKRTDKPEARANMMRNIDAIVKAKLGQGAKASTGKKDPLGIR